MAIIIIFLFYNPEGYILLFSFFIIHRVILTIKWNNKSKNVFCTFICKHFWAIKIIYNQMVLGGSCKKVQELISLVRGQLHL